ncbi:gluconokinase [Aestuariivivens marinum]|uniref:gluconokinase n=1 Tax=Aestuariivivens marinum TaxID=2913555 RepID=UPI001F5A92D6|nr:gluconokinase [Aestuariivivens marinum]
MIIIMGVSGCGKTTIGLALSKQLDLPYYDADDFHSQVNIEKMKNAIPLNDQDRKPWLETLAKNIEIWNEQGGGILSCSALKESYRQILSLDNNITWVYLKGTFKLIQSRLEQREDHYMTSALLHSQFEVLEEPNYGLHINIDATPELLVSKIISKLKAYG